MTTAAEAQTGCGRLLIIAGSLRDERLAPTISAWLAGLAEPLDFTDITIIDLAEVDLPDDRLLEPGGGPPTSVTSSIAASDAFAFVTPEYNHSYPAGLKRLIDWHFSEWAFKPALIAAYGARGGQAATEHLRGVLAELSVIAIRRSLSLTAPWADCSEDGYRPGTGTDEAAAAALGELAWWSRTMLTARREHPFAGR